jgi:hypothetical protein
MAVAWRVLARLAIAAIAVAGMLLAATFGTSMALCNSEQIV